MRRIDRRRTTGIVIGQDRRHQIARRRAHAVEMAESPVAMTEEPQKRHHPVDRLQHGGRHFQTLGHEGLPDRQKIGQNIDQGSRIARNMTAIGQDLTGKLLIKPADALPGETVPGRPWKYRPRRSPAPHEAVRHRLRSR